MHGFVDDLYSDLSLNPAYINRYQGTWLYTNLSNLQGGDESSVFDDKLSALQNTDIVPNNLIGTITNRFGSSTGLFLETRGKNLTVDDLSNSEQFTSINTGTISSTLEMIESDNSSQSLSYIGLFGDIGFSISVHRNNFDLLFKNENTESSFTVAASENGPIRTNTSFVNKTTTRSFDFPNSMIGFSVGKIFKNENQKISIAAGMRPERMAFDGNEVLSLFKDSFLSGIADKFEILDDQNLGFLETGLRSTYVNARIKKIYPSVTQLQQNSLIFNYTKYSMPFDVETVERSVSDSLDISGVNRKNVVFTRNNVAKADGNGSLNRIEFGAGVERHFTEQNTLLGLGIKLDYIWGDLDIVFNPGRINEDLAINVEIADPAAEAESFSRIISDNKIGLTRNEISGTFLSVPNRFGNKSVQQVDFTPGCPLDYTYQL